MDKIVEVITSVNGARETPMLSVYPDIQAEQAEKLAAEE